MTDMTTTDELLPVEQCVMICPQCEGEGGYPDGLDEDACHTECTRCGSNGWIVDTARIASTRPADSADRCPYCDDTGDVHDATGEWRGECKHGPADSALAESLEAAVARADDTPGMRISILRCAISDAIKALRQPAPRADDALLDADKAEVERLHSLCKANNDLAKHNGDAFKEERMKSALLADALDRIAAHTDADDPESYRSDDREGCLETVHAIARAALAASEPRKPWYTGDPDGE